MEAKLSQTGYTHSLIHEAMIGFLTGFFILSYAVASSSIIFTGSLINFLPIGVSSALIGTALSNIFIPAGSSLKGAIAWPSAPLAAILSITFARIATITPTEFLPVTIKAAIILLTFISGVLLFIVGSTRISKLLSYTPYPVMAGFILGTAWFLLKGTLHMLIQTPFNPSDLLTTQYIQLILPPALFGLVVCLAGRFIQKKITMPLLMLGGIIVMYLFFTFENLPLNGIASSQLYLLKPNQLFQIWGYWSLSSLQNIYWPSIIDQLYYILGIFIIILIVQSLNVTSLEVETNQKINFNQQFKLEGTANIIISLMGGLLSTLSLTGTIFNHSLGARSRISSYMAALFCIIIIFFFPHTLNYIPRFIIAGILFQLSFNMFLTYLIDIWKKVYISDYLIILGILISTIFGGFILGIIVGLALTCLTFVIKYSTLGIIKYAMSGENLHSKRKYSVSEERILADHRHGIFIYKLQGFLFFGAANTFYETIINLISKKNKHPLEYIILDFQLVSGIDSSVSFKFIMIERLLKKHNIILLIVDCSPTLLNILQKMQTIENVNYTFDDLDHALEWWEKRIIKQESSEIIKKPAKFTFESLFSSIEKQNKFLSYLTKIEYGEDNYVCHQGDHSDSMFLFESGKITVYIELPDGKHKRVLISNAPTTIGEVGFFLNTNRTATVITNKPSVIYQLFRKDFELMEKEAPDIVIDFLKTTTNILSERLVGMNKTIELME